MHPQSAEALLASVRLRERQGDCPTEPALSVETLENLVIEIASQRDRATNPADQPLRDSGPSDEPLPCPFCGSRALVEQRGTGGWCVECDSDECAIMPETGSLHDHDSHEGTGGTPLSRADAIAKWNRRAPATPLSATNNDPGDPTIPPSASGAKDGASKAQQWARRIIDAIHAAAAVRMECDAHMARMIDEILVVVREMQVAPPALSEDRVELVRALIGEALDGGRLAPVEISRDVGYTLRALLADHARLSHRVETLEAALRPFAVFANQWDRQPLRNMEGTIYAIHVGTEYEAELTLDDLHRAARALTSDTPQP